MALLGGTESGRVPGGSRDVTVGGVDFGLRTESTGWHQSDVQEA